MRNALPETLSWTARTALETVPGFDRVAIALTRPNGGIRTMVASDDLVWELDAVQYGLDQGPCVDAVRGEQPVVRLEHAGQDPRWPQYLPGAVARGLRSQLSVRLWTGEQALGGINFYSTVSDTIDSQASDIAELLAAQASIALSHAQQAQQLQEAVATRQVIGQAVGIVMERYGISHHAAFEYLARESQVSNTKLRVLAQELVDATERGSSR